MGHSGFASTSIASMPESKKMPTPCLICKRPSMDTSQTLQTLLLHGLEEWVLAGQDGQRVQAVYRLHSREHGGV